MDADALAALYRTMHIVLLPSRATQTWVEQFGRVIVEAQASGAVLAGYDSGSIAEVSGVAGVVVGEGDWRELSGAILALCAEPARYEALRAEGQRNVAAMTWDHVAQRQLQFYERALSAAGSGDTRPAGRAAAIVEFGAPTRLSGDLARPFAAPGLRADNAVTRGLARALDAVAIALGRLRV